MIWENKGNNIEDNVADGESILVGYYKEFACGIYFFDIEACALKQGKVISNIRDEEIQKKEIVRWSKIEMLPNLSKENIIEKLESLEHNDRNLSRISIIDDAIAYLKLT